MAPTDLGDVIDQDHLALAAFMRGDPEPKKRLYSRGDDATLSNPFGPPALGWNAIERTLDAASSALREGESIRFERVSAFARAHWRTPSRSNAYSGVKLGGADERVGHALRVTTIFRLEPDGWRIVHRHADPITIPRGPESPLER